MAELQARLEQLVKSKDKFEAAETKGADQKRSDRQELLSELEQMKLSELKERAKANGIDSAIVENIIDDADDPKNAVADMIVTAELRKKVLGT